jgi:predicted nucleic acid-binding protein
MRYLLDSNIIIYYLNGDETIYTFLNRYKKMSSISIITYYEVLNFDFDAEEGKIIKEFLDSFEVLNISKNIINKALENRKVKKIKMADNFILATAQLHNLELITRNIKDFQSFDVAIGSIDELSIEFSPK